MIKRIKSIKEVGVFTNCNGGQYDFGDLTVIYGYNIQGKTTLSKILTAIGDDDVRMVAERKTIPHDDSKNQDVVISHAKDGDPETSISFSNNGWGGNSLVGKILVFDDSFIHKNLISGYEVTRQNRESFTDFILGEEGVRLSEKIRELNKNIRIEKGKLATIRKLLPNMLDENQLVKFLTMSVADDMKLLRKKKELIEKSIENLDNISAIVALPTINKENKIEVSKDIKELVDRINSVLIKSYSDINSDALDKVKQHISSHMKINNTANSWLQAGLSDQCKINNCPFCGQDLDPATALIDAYRGVFDEAFKSYANDIGAEIITKTNEIDTLNRKNHLDGLNSLIQELAKYQKFSDNMDISIEETSIIKAQEVFRSELLDFTKDAKTNFDSKKNSPHTPLDEVEVSKDLESAIKDLQEAVEVERKKLTKAIKQAEKIKSVSRKTEEELEEENTRITKNLNIVNWQIIRFEQKNNCDEYIK